jgi:hypothetical protein
MRRLAQDVLLVAAVFCFPLQALAAPLTPMTPKEIQATFGTGTSFSSSTPTGTTYTIVLNSDGTASRTPRRSKVAITGTWRVSKDGYCSTWAKSMEKCFKIEKDTDRYKVLDKSGTVAAYWKTK